MTTRWPAAPTSGSETVRAPQPIHVRPPGLTRPPTFCGEDSPTSETGRSCGTSPGQSPLVHSAGADVSRSTAERAAGESIWAPTELVPGTDVEWHAEAPDRVSMSFEVDGHDVTLIHDLDHEGRIRGSSFDRWGDPESTGTWGLHPFGVEVTSTRAFGQVTIPSSGRAGWHCGTPRRADREFFRLEITDCTLVQ